jgi:hypothetical protein
MAENANQAGGGRDEGETEREQGDVSAPGNGMVGHEPLLVPGVINGAFLTAGIEASQPGKCQGFS